MYDVVLFPTDGSEGSVAAAEHAVSLAERYGAALHVLHVVALSDVSAALDEAEQRDIYDRLETAGQQAVAEVREVADGADLPAVEGTVRRGDPRETILEYAAEADADVLVMATAGRSGRSREVMGSVTESVVRQSSLPVLTVNVGDRR